VDTQTRVALIAAIAALALVVWFDVRCLKDMARVPDEDLRWFDRGTWTLVILLMFPLGPMLYLMSTRGPNRF
jgi:hypothetical protein